MNSNTDPRFKYPRPPFKLQPQAQQPGKTQRMTPEPDHGESTYRGSGRLEGFSALITGGDSGIGRATALAFAREGADLAISYLPSEQDEADATRRSIERENKRCILIPGDLRAPHACEALIEQSLEELHKLDVIVLNAGTQHSRDKNADITREEILEVFETNLIAPLLLMRAAAPSLKPGASVIVTASIQAFNPSPDLLDYAMTKAALVAFTRALASEQGERGVRVNAVAPGPIWTPLIPATGWSEKQEQFGADSPLGRPGQPAEVAAAYVYLASEEASYVSGAVLPVTGGKHL